MLSTRDRREMNERALRSFDAQASAALWWHYDSTGSTAPLCELMNRAMESALHALPNITHLAKWDSDDWSAPERLPEQLALMERTGAWVVGYHTLPFYDTRTREVLLYSNPNPNYALGTSLLMRREAWEEFPFPDTSKRPGNPRGTGSDTLFVQHWAGRGRVASVSSIGDAECIACDGSGRGDTGPCWKCDGRTRTPAPRMIATIHGANTSVDPARGGFRPADWALAQRVSEIMEAA